MPEDNKGLGRVHHWTRRDCYGLWVPTLNIVMKYVTELIMSKMLNSNIKLSIYVIWVTHTDKQTPKWSPNAPMIEISMKSGAHYTCRGYLLEAWWSCMIKKEKTIYMRLPISEAVITKIIEVVRWFFMTRNKLGWSYRVGSDGDKDNPDLAINRGHRNLQCVKANLEQ